MAILHDIHMTDGFPLGKLIPFDMLCQAALWLALRFQAQHRYSLVELQWMVVSWRPVELVDDDLLKDMRF